MASIANFCLAPKVAAARHGRFAGSRVSKVTNGGVVCMLQKDKQPEWFEEAKVYCNGEEVMTVGGTQAEYVVDIWSGNHPFFLGKSTAIMTNAGRVSKFGDKFGDLGALSEVETIDDIKAENDAEAEK